MKVQCLSLVAAIIFLSHSGFVTAEHQQHPVIEPEVENLRGDPEDLTPLHPSHFIYTPPRPTVPPPPPPPKVWENYKYKATKGDQADLAVAATRHRPRQQSYSRHYNPRPRHYSSQGGHHDGKKTKGGYQTSNSYQGRKGYASESSFDRANQGKYADGDHKEYNHKDGHSSSGGHNSGGGRSYGGYGGEYGDNGNSYTRPEY